MSETGQSEHPKENLPQRVESRDIRKPTTASHIEMIYSRPVKLKIKVCSFYIAAYAPDRDYRIVQTPTGYNLFVRFL
jgi:hypothetical protein